MSFLSHSPIHPHSQQLLLTFLSPLSWQSALKDYIHELTTSTSSKENIPNPMLKAALQGTGNHIEFITRETAENEKRALKREVEHLREGKRKVEEKADARVKEVQERLDELKQVGKFLHSHVF